MNWRVEKGTMADAGTIAGFQVDMALESEGTVLDRHLILKGVSAGLSDPDKGTYYLVKTELGETAGSLFLTKEWSDWNNCWYWWIQSVFIKPEYRRIIKFLNISIILILLNNKRIQIEIVFRKNPQFGPIVANII